MTIISSARSRALQKQLREFMQAHVYPAVPTVRAAERGHKRWSPLAVVESLKPLARAAGLWNLFLPGTKFGAGLSNLEYAPLAEEMGRVHWASEVFNCSAPDTGNMEVLAHFGSPAQQERWLRPLLNGEIRSAYVMTEPAVASSDATNIEFAMRRDGESWVLNGRKWWITGLGHPSCQLLLVFGCTGGEGRHSRHSIIIVPRDAPGVKMVRPLTTFGYDDAPNGHYEVSFTDVRVPIDHMVLGEGRGFEIAQGRLGPGRIHHCMRSIGAAEQALALMCRRLQTRTTFGTLLSKQSVWQERVAEARCRIDMARLLTLNAAHLMDTVGNKGARKEIAMIKVVAPAMACRVIDWAIQAFGAAGVSDDFGLAQMYATQRTLRIADGPDEVHRVTVAKLELATHPVVALVA